MSEPVPARQGHPWTKDEDLRLLKGVRRERHWERSKFAAAHMRTEKAITARLERLAAAAGVPTGFDGAMSTIRRQPSGFSRRASTALWSDPLYSAQAEAYRDVWEATHGTAPPIPEPIRLQGVKLSFPHLVVPKLHDYQRNMLDEIARGYGGAMTSTTPANNTASEITAKQLEKVWNEVVKDTPQPDMICIDDPCASRKVRDFWFSDLKTKESKPMDLSEKFYVVMTVDARQVFGSPKFSRPMSEADATTYAKGIAADSPYNTCVMLEAKQTFALGKVRSTAVKAARKPAKRKVIKVPEGAEVVYVKAKR